MTSDVDALLEWITAHLARVEPDTCGFGRDPYHATPADHAMAYAYYARGYASLYRATSDERYLGAADVALERLVGLPTPGDHLAWGLPFTANNLEPGHPYAITTALCSLAFLERHLSSPHDASLEAAHDACRWLTRTLPWTDVAGTRAPTYAPGFPAVAVNVAAMVAAALYGVAGQVGAPRFRADAVASLVHVRDAQAESGFWPYASPEFDACWPSHRRGEIAAHRVVDNLHSAYVLDGAGIAVRAGAGSAGAMLHLRPMIAHGLDFLSRHLYLPSGRGFEKLVIADEGDPTTRRLLRRRAMPRRYLSAGRWLVAYPAETRLWGYGATVAMFSRLHLAGIHAVDDSAVGILRWLAGHHLRDPSGRFPLLSDDPSAFPRHEAHLFDGLCSLVEALSVGSRAAHGPPVAR